MGGGSVKWFKRRKASQVQQTMVLTAKGNDAPCRCDPEWPELETEINGYRTPVEPSEHWSPVSAGLLGELEARCARCHATYPGVWNLKPGTPPPFAWAREDDA